MLFLLYYMCTYEIILVYFEEKNEKYCGSKYYKNVRDRKIVSKNRTFSSNKNVVNILLHYFDGIFYLFSKLARISYLNIRHVFQFKI